MPWLGDVGRRIAMFMRRARIDRELDEEIRLHLDLIEQQQRDRGAPPVEAAAIARGRFGSPMRIKEDSHQAIGGIWLVDLARDLRYAVRSLSRQKTFATAAIVTLALGIGANTAIFSVVSGVLFRPLPFKDPERLVQVRGSSALMPRGDAINAPAEVRSQSQSFEHFVAYEVTARFLRVATGTERVLTVRAEPDFFDMLGSSPLIGRTFGSGDPAAVAVVGETFWRERLAASPSAIGTTLTLDDQPFTVVGIMPASFQFPYNAASLLKGVAASARTDLWIPLDPPLRPRSRIGNITARLKPGVPIDTANGELEVIARRLEAQFPEQYAGRGIYVESLTEAVVGPSVRRPLLVLFGAVALVLALACANVTNLSLVRMTLRSKEVAVRLAMGAGRGRLMRQFIAESMLLSLVGGAIGLLFAWSGTRQLMDLVRIHVPRAYEAGLDWRVFLFLLTVCAVAATISGLLPALLAMRSGVQAALQQTGERTTMGVGQRRVRDGLVVVEVALACVLAIGATLLVREVVRLRNTPTGMSADNVLTFHLGHRMTPDSNPRKFYDIVERVSQVPGVRTAGFTQMLPLQNWGWSSNSTDFRVAGGPPPSSPVFPIELRYVTPEYFHALGIPIRGRAFSERDNRDAPPVILINETLARRYFGSEDPVGTRMNRGTIVGVVGDVRQVDLHSTALPEIYFPIAQNWSQVSELGMSLVVRADQPPDGLIEPVRLAIREVDPNLAIFTVKTMDRVIADSLSALTLFLWLMVSFAIVALLLATTGTYGVMSYVAASRSKEFAVRVALGADRSRVIRLVLAQGIRITAAGLAIGLVAAMAVIPLLDDLPIVLGRPDLTTTALVAAFIAVAAIVACLLPARRAAGLNPMSILRDE